MPWSNILRTEIQRMDLSMDGTPIRFWPQKVDRNNVPLLMIGLGGTGLKIGRQLQDLMIERFNPSPSPFPGTRELLPPRTRFLAIDTDWITMDRMEFAPSERCLISNPMMAQKLRPENRGMLPLYIQEWLNPHLNVRLNGMMTGAQCVPQLGRFALFDNFRTVYNSLQIAIKQLYTGYGSLLVTIAAGIAGGTGAGTFLDIAYLVRHIAKEMNISNHVRIIGTLVLPDLYAYMNPHNVGLMRANGYAALKELDYWMEAPDRRDDFTQQYAPDVTVKWDKSPFDQCILAGFSPDIQTKRPDDAVFTNIVQFLAALCEGIHPQILVDQSYFSWRGNVLNNLQHYAKSFDVCRRYTVLGCASFEMPLQKLILNETMFLFDKVRECCDADRTPDLYDGNEYVDFVQRIVGNCATELLAPINIKSPRDVAIAQIRNSDHLAPHSPDIDDTVKEYFDQLESRSMGAEAIEMITERVRMLEQQLIAMFADPEKGPFYASRYIDATPGKYVSAEGGFEVSMPNNFTLKMTLEGLRTAALVRRTQAHNDYIHQQKLAHTEYQAIRTSLFPLMQNGPTARRYYTVCEYMNMFKREYWHQDVLCRLYDALITRLDKISTQVFKPLCAALVELIRLFRDTEVYLRTPDYRTHHPENARDTAALNVLMAQFHKYMSPDRVLAMTKTLFRDMMRPYVYDPDLGQYEPVPDGERWLIPLDYHRILFRFNIRENLQRVVNNIFRAFNSQSLNDLWIQQYPDAVSPNGSLNLDQIVRDLEFSLSTAATPMFMENPIYPLTFNNFSIPRSDYITIPGNVPGLRTQMNPSVHRQIKNAQSGQRVFWAHALDGVSLFHYGALRTCEMDYLNLVSSNCAYGIHLCESHQRNWFNLPNPMPRAARSDNNRSLVQEKADDAMIARIDALLQSGQIELVNMDSAYRLYFSTEHSRQFSQAFMNELSAGTVSLDEVLRRKAQILSLREMVELPIVPSILSNYPGEHGKQQLLYDMLLQRPAMVDAMERDTAALKELERATALFLQR